MWFEKYLLFLILLTQSNLLQAQNPDIGAPMGIQELPNNSEVINIIGIYPNPAVDYIIIEIEKS